MYVSILCLTKSRSSTGNALDAYTLPEMLRVPLDETILQVHLDEHVILSLLCLNPTVEWTVCCS